MLVTVSSCVSRSLFLRCPFKLKSGRTTHQRAVAAGFARFSLVQRTVRLPFVRAYAAFPPGGGAKSGLSFIPQQHQKGDALKEYVSSAMVILLNTM